MEAVIFLVVAVILGVLAIRLGMMLAPLVGRLSPADEPDPAAPGTVPETADADDTTTEEPR